MDPREGTSTAVLVRLLADYNHEDITLRRGEQYVVLGYHGDDWVFVSRGDSLQPCYVPTCCVQHVGQTPVQSPEIKQRTLPATSLSLSRSRTFASPSDSKTTSGMAGVIRSLSMRNSLRDSSPPTSPITRELDSDSDDLPEPPSYSVSSPAVRDVITLATSTGDKPVRQDDRDVTTDALPTPVDNREDDGDVIGVQPSDLSDETNRRSQHQEVSIWYSVLGTQLPFRIIYQNVVRLRDVIDSCDFHFICSFPSFVISSKHENNNDHIKR